MKRAKCPLTQPPVHSLTHSPNHFRPFLFIYSLTVLYRLLPYYNYCLLILFSLSVQSAIGAAPAHIQDPPISTSGPLTRAQGVSQQYEKPESRWRALLCPPGETDKMNTHVAFTAKEESSSKPSTNVHNYE